MSDARLQAPVLDGDVVRLRPLRPGDAPAYAAAFRDDPDLGRAAGYEEDPDEAGVLERIANGGTFAELGSAVAFAVAGRDDDAFAGDVVLHGIDRRHERAEIGFWIAPRARGRGLAVAGCSLLLDWAFDHLALHRVQLLTTPDNAPALAVAARLGFTDEGTLRDWTIERGDRVTFRVLSLLAPEWRSRRVRR